VAAVTAVVCGRDHGQTYQASGESRNDSDMVGGEDPDSIESEDDFSGDSEVDDRRSGRLVAPDEGAHPHTESDMLANHLGILVVPQSRTRMSSVMIIAGHATSRGTLLVDPPPRSAQGRPALMNRPREDDEGPC
jgi:hypothetical protein